MAERGAIQIKFRPYTLKEIRRRLGLRARQVINLRRPNAKAAVLLDRWVQLNFRTEGGKVGGWAPFKYGGRLIPQKPYIDPSAKLLQDTGRLRASFETFHNKTRVEIRSRVPYAVYHEFGTATLPQRRMLPRGDEFLPEIIKIYQRHVDRLTSKRLL